MILSVCSSIVLFSCQKEADFTNGDNGNGNGGGGGNSNGDLLVKALEITIATHDTNVITVQWDASKRLIDYHSKGKVDGIDEETHYAISRLADGKITKIKQTSALTAGLVDSVVYVVHYVPGTSKLAYDIATQYTFIGELTDSVVFTYDASGAVTSQEDFSDVFGVIAPSSKMQFLYDANGNVTTIKSYSANGSGGYDPVSTDTYTYGPHKSPYTLGEEAFVAIGAPSVSKNDPTGAHIAAINDPTHVYDIAYDQQQYNSFDRPVSGVFHVMPQPPGYDVKVLYYYQ